MSRIKVSKTISANDAQKSKEWPAVVYASAFAMAISGYAIARVGLSGLPHPYHWTSGILGGALGILIGWIWYRWRGDII